MINLNIKHHELCPRQLFNHQQLHLEELKSIEVIKLNLERKAIHLFGFWIKLFLSFFMVLRAQYWSHKISTNNFPSIIWSKEQTRQFAELNYRQNLLTFTTSFLTVPFYQAIAIEYWL